MLAEFVADVAVVGMQFSGVLNKLGQLDVERLRQSGEFIERNIFTPALNFRKVRPTQIRFFSQFFQGQTRVGSARADVIPHDLPMFADMSH